jgi:NmrA-like family
LRLLAAATFYTFWKGTTTMKVPIDKLVLVIGGTGAQGQAVVKALLEPTSDGAPSPYAMRILTRNRDHPKVGASKTMMYIRCYRF